MNPLYFYGFDDVKSGSPSLQEGILPDSKKRFNCILTHNPDAVPLFLSKRALADIPLVLAGHTHGGKVRIHILGAKKNT